MMIRSAALVMFVGLMFAGVGACSSDGGSEKPSAEGKSQGESKTASDSGKSDDNKTARDDGGDDKSSGDDRRSSKRARDRKGASDEKASSDEKSSSEGGSSDGEFGIKACDDYVKQVGECTTFNRDSAIFKGLMKAWHRAIDDGKSADVEEKCKNAAKLFRCPKK